MRPAGERGSDASPGRPDSSPLSENILRSVASGVIALDGEGRVSVFNAAAEKLLGLAAADVVGRTMGEAFIALEGLDELTDAILHAVYHAVISEQRIVSTRIEGTERSFSVSTSYLRNDEGAGARSAGVVAVFDDISEVKELRETEIRLARESHERRSELEEAYMSLEARNAELSRAMRKIVLARWAATGLVILFFVGMGLYFWKTDVGFGDVRAAEAKVSAQSVRTFPVEPRLLQSHVTVRGRLEPLQSLAINSPFGGRVKKLFFDYGEQVEKGQPLVELDTSRIVVELREARVAYITAEQAHRRLTDPTHNTGVSSARLALHRARIDMDVTREELEEQRFLLERGVVPRDQFKAMERNYDNQKINLASAKGNLEIVLADNETSKIVSELSLENARTRLDDLEKSHAQAVIRAPVSGVILSAPATGQAGGSAGGASSGGAPLAVGEDVERGARLLTIGDLTGLSIASKADEIDIGAIRKGLPVRVSGDGFRGITLDGAITHVSSEAAGAGSTPTFELTAHVLELTAEQRKVLRLGMSARLDVLVYENKEALLVPLGAVDSAVDPPVVRVRAPDGAVREVPVETGLTNLDSVEILDGLEAGAIVLVAGG